MLEEEVVRELADGVFVVVVRERLCAWLEGGEGPRAGFRICGQCCCKREDAVGQVGAGRRRCVLRVVALGARPGVVALLAVELPVRGGDCLEELGGPVSPREQEQEVLLVGEVLVRPLLSISIGVLLG